jgi:hypothetical protein
MEQQVKLNRLQIMWLDRHYQIRKRREKIVRWVAWHLPHELVMWCYYRVAAHATGMEYPTSNASEVLMMEAIGRWDTAKK